MSCPYRTHAQFVKWLVKYKGWKKKDTDNLSTHDMRLMYYNGTPNLKKKKNLPVVYKQNEPIMDFDEACLWYQKQLYYEELAKSQGYDTVEESFGDEFTNPRGE